MRRSASGMTLMETLIASAVALMLCMIVALTGSNLMRAKRIQDEVSRQTLLQRTLDSRLREMLSTADVKGVHQSADGHILSVQQLSSVSTDGQRRWSAVAHLVIYEPARKLLVLKTVPFEEAGLTSSSTSPVPLSERELQRLVSSQGRGLAMYDEITEAKFTFLKPQAVLSALVRRSIHNSRDQKDELLLQSSYGLRSSTELRRRGLGGVR